MLNKAESSCLYPVALYFLGKFDVHPIGIFGQLDRQSPSSRSRNFNLDLMGRFVPSVVNFVLARRTNVSNAQYKVLQYRSDAPFNEPTCLQFPVITEIPLACVGIGHCRTPIKRKSYGDNTPSLSNRLSAIRGRLGLSPPPHPNVGGPSASQKGPSREGYLNKSEDDTHADKDFQKDVAHPAGIASPAAPANHVELDGLASSPSSATNGASNEIYIDGYSSTEISERKAQPAAVGDHRFENKWPSGANCGYPGAAFLRRSGSDNRSTDSDFEHRSERLIGHQPLTQYEREVDV